jgi:hypothetical protein
MAAREPLACPVPAGVTITRRLAAWPSRLALTQRHRALWTRRPAPPDFIAVTMASYAAKIREV